MNEMNWKLINVFAIVCISILAIALYKWIYKKIIVKHFGESIRDKYMKGISTALILFIAVNIVFSQFETTKSVQKYFVTNVAFLVAIISFSVKEVFSDLLAGLMIAIHRPFDVGAKITLDSRNLSGVVENITPRHTVIRCYDNTRLLVPNSVINKEIIRNYDYVDCSNGSFIEITISYDSDMKKAIEIMRRVILEEPLVRDVSKNPDTTRELKIQVHGLTKDGVDLKAMVWTKTTDENFTACTNIRMRLKEEYDKNGIVITA